MKPEKLANADQALEAKLDGLDDHLEPLDAEAKDPVEPTEEKVEEAEEHTEVKEPEKEPEEDEGYTIDEGEEEVKETPTEAIKPSQLSPEQQYIVDNLKPITVRGKVNDGTLQTFEVYSPEQLPIGFKYVDDRELSTANKAFGMLETRATQLEADYRNQATQQASKDFKDREDNADRSDIGRLQREGDLPKFKTEPGSKTFDKDPATVLIQEIIDFKESTNKRYLDEYNAGRPFKHIGFEEAFRLYKRENPNADPEQIKEDADRRKVAERTSKTRGGGGEVANEKPRIHSGMGPRDLDALIESKTKDW